VMVRHNVHRSGALRRRGGNHLQGQRGGAGRAGGGGGGEGAKSVQWQRQAKRAAEAHTDAAGQERACIVESRSDRATHNARHRSQPKPCRS
jgi:hypothetical protein